MRGVSRTDGREGRSGGLETGVAAAAGVRPLRRRELSEPSVCSIPVSEACPEGELTTAPRARGGARGGA